MSLTSLSPGGRSSAAASGEPLRRVRDSEHDLRGLVRRAREGDDAAWNRLVTRFDRLIRNVARRYRLQPADVDDVVQTVWMHLLGDIHRVREPAALPGWLATASSRECIRVRQHPVREQLTDDSRLGDQATPADAEMAVLQTERRSVVAGALGSLPARHRKLLVLLASQAEPDYELVSQTLAMPIGSIGPIRKRSIERLQDHPSVLAYSGAQ